MCLPVAWSYSTWRTFSPSRRCFCIKGHSSIAGAFSELLLVFFSSTYCWLYFFLFFFFSLKCKINKLLISCLKKAFVEVLALIWTNLWNSDMVIYIVLKSWPGKSTWQLCWFSFIGMPPDLIFWPENWGSTQNLHVNTFIFNRFSNC